jgi:predicted nuclease with RNAse H fold
VVALARGTWEGRPLDDECLRAVIAGETELGAPAKVAIDAPFGWPEPFVAAVSAHQAFGAWPAGGTRRLALRRTDERVHASLGKRPLSVSTDRIAYCAMRAAGLIEDHARDGSGLLVEAYPAAALQVWIGRSRYKGDEGRARRAEIVDALGFDVDRDTCIASDDALDAFVCALVARAAMRGMTIGAGPEDVRLARTEGWIHVPCPGSLQRLR